MFRKPSSSAITDHPMLLIKEDDKRGIQTKYSDTSTTQEEKEAEEQETSD